MENKNNDTGPKRFLAEGSTFASIGNLIMNIPLKEGFRPSVVSVFIVALMLCFVLQIAITWLFIKGVGIWGVNIPVAWGFAITNFVWWIGIGHAGTFISAFLYLLHQEWRASINRFSETITLFAVMCAGMFPFLHLGRWWFAYWLVPYPNTMGLWPQFRSALVWDIFAVSTYFTVSVVFWYTGLIPDLGAARDRAQNILVKKFYGILSLGWRGAGVHWQRHKTAYLIMAGLATPLVVSVHTVVSFDFAITLVPGWHSTIFPPYFVGGAIFSGFAMVLTLMLPIRKLYGLERVITQDHLDLMSKIMLTTGLIVGYGYLMEAFIGWYSGNFYEWFHTKNQLTGPYGFLFVLLLLCNVCSIQILWFKNIRRNALILFFLSIVINIGMWAERFVIVIGSLNRDFMPSAWHLYFPTVWDWATLIGSLGLFMTGFLIFFRVFPLIASYEVEDLAAKIQKGNDHEQ
ncbi:MAG: NrfD/PsrC family molybdoenzyme membrane anchor subunit [Endomicrobiales bacterium]|jgi:molybdopterin-containing oxidoreductase family membrane subunit